MAFLAPTALVDLPGARLGEGPWWDVETQRLYWVDIQGHKIHRWNPATGLCETHPTGTYVGFALLDRHGRVVAGLRDAIHALDFGTPRKWLLARPAMHPENRFNDAACDPRGRLWAGTMHIEASRDRAPTGALYRLDPGGLTVVERDIGIANGLGWSPNGATMYFAETHRGTIWAYDYDLDTGEATNRRPFAEVPVDIGVPDGLTVDSAGRVHVCVWGGARIDVYAPSGVLDAVIAMPVPCPTSCCFGGPDLRTLYITTASNGPDGDLTAGCLFAMAADVAGLPCHRADVPIPPG